LSPAPFLSACALAIPELKRRAAGGRAAGDVQTLVELAERAVVAVPDPILGDCPVAGEKLDRGPVVCARTGVVDAFAGGAEDRALAAIFRFDDGRCVEVATGVDRMCATQILALSPVERSGAAARRPANREASDIGTIPNLLGKEIAVIGGIGHRLQVDICGAAVRDLVLPVFLRKNKPKPPVIIRSVDDPPPRAIAVALTVDIAAGHRDLQRRVAVRCANRAGNSKVAVRFAHEPYFDHTQSIIGLKQNWFKDVGITFEPDNKGIVVNAGDVSAVYSSGRVEGEFQDGVIQAQFGEVDLDSLGD
jgi:hypothetical protein